jgi:hypothetical protein
MIGLPSVTANSAEDTKRLACDRAELVIAIITLWLRDSQDTV